MVSVFQPFVSIGSLAAAVVSNALHNNLTKHSYQIQLAILYAVPLFLFIVVPFLPESPRWCVVQGDVAQARSSLRRLRPAASTPEFLDGEIEIIQDAVDMERRLASTVVWKDIWRGADLVRTSILKFPVVLFMARVASAVRCLALLVLHSTLRAG